MKNILKLIISILIPFISGIMSGSITAKNIQIWYNNLTKPSWSPPNWLFGPVWITLYIMMGIAFYLIWISDDVEHWKTKAYSIFGVQLVLNIIWSFIFFEIKWMGVALLEIIVLWVAIFLTILVFSKLNKKAAWLLVPYIMWVSFASYLNYTIWYLNKLQ